MPKGGLEPKPAPLAGSASLLFGKEIDEIWWWETRPGETPREPKRLVPLGVGRSFERPPYPYPSGGSNDR